MQEELAQLREQLKQLQVAATKSTFELHLRKKLDELSKAVRKYKNDNIDSVLHICTTTVHQAFPSPSNYCGIELLDDLGQQLVLRSASNVPDVHTNKMASAITIEQGGKKTLQQFTIQNRDAPTIFSDINNDARFDHSFDHHAIFPDTTSGISIALISDNFSEQDPSTKSDAEKTIKKLREGGEEYGEAIIGRFFVYFIDRHEFSDEELWFFTKVADLVADAVNRFKLRNRLSESNERFKILADCSPVMLWMTNTSSLCTWFNRQWLVFRGRTLEEEYGNGWTEGIHTDDYHHTMRSFLLNFKKRKCFQIEYRLLRNDGEYRWIRHTGAPRMTSNGEFEGFVGSSVDVTEIKESQIAVFEAKQIEENIKAKNKLVEQFVTDTRNPLESILEMNSLLLDMKLTAEQRSYAEGVQMGTELLMELFKDLFDLTKTEPVKTKLKSYDFQVFDAVEHVIEFITQSQRLKKMDLELISFIEPKIPLLNGDSLRIKQLIMNILTDHLSHCGDGSVIYIRTRLGSESDDRVQLKIDFKHISGDLSHRRNKSIMNFGDEALGIYIARQLVQAMEGEISVVPDAGRFCKVKLWLDKAASGKYDAQTLETPTDIEDTSQSDDAEIFDLQSSLCDNDGALTHSTRLTCPTSDIAREVRILIVDPHPVAIDTITAYLHTVPNYAIDSCVTINETVRMISHSLEAKTPYDLILLDFKFETLGRFMMQSHPKMFKTTKWVPIMMPQDSTRLNRLEWKYTTVVYKPIRMCSLLDAVSYAVTDLT